MIFLCRVIFVVPEQPSHNPLLDSLKTIRLAFVAVGLFSFAINLLMLTGPLFMLQIYDRILTSRSVSTLVALFVLVVGLYTFMGIFDLLRVRVLSRAGYCLDHRLNVSTYTTWISQSIRGGTDVYKPLNDLSTIRTFMGSAALLAVFDLPWFPFFLGVVFLLHVQLGVLALAGAVIVVMLALANEFFTRQSLGQAVMFDMHQTKFSEQSYRNAESIVSMGMLDHLADYWNQLRQRSTKSAQEGGERAEVFAAISKSIRLLLQSAILGLGAYLAINQEISPGMIVAASIIAGRALAPIDQVIGNWRSIHHARLAYRRLSTHLCYSSENAIPEVTSLPDPQGNVIVHQLTKLKPNSSGSHDGDNHVILENIAFELKAGEGLGVIGSTGSGKSSLARLLVGVWMPDSGSVRLDGATLDQWNRSELGRHIGYLSQDIELLSGTIAQNICRFSPHAHDEDIVKAAILAEVHEMILQLPEGYATQVGSHACSLSGGQKQRIGLARAVYQTPALVVLDEPNSNLDSAGDDALTQAIIALRKAGSSVVVMAHRPSAISAVDKLLMLDQGQQKGFGKKTDVLRKFTKAVVA